MVAKSATKGTVSMSVFNNLEEEAEKISDAISKINDYENTAILYRMNSRSLLFEKYLAMKRIPYKVLGDMPYYKRKVSKDLLSYCKAATNTQDIESLVRIVNVPKRGFGDAKQEKLFSEGWPYLHQMAAEMPEIENLIDLLQEIKYKSPLNAINEVLQKTNYKSTLTKDTDQHMLDSFLDIISGFKTIEELVLTSTFLEKDSGHGVKLMTAHASKGLEFNNVFVVGVESEIWPHKLSDNIPEEERLYYVACTRSRAYLNLSCSRSRLFRGQSIPTSPSSLFLKSYSFIKSCKI
jgi:DNA helicase-2/ATP-dependent DNA helicase PcrA